jgi:hypothetical protein
VEAWNQLSTVAICYFSPTQPINLFKSAIYVFSRSHIEIFQSYIESLSFMTSKTAHFPLQCLKYFANDIFGSRNIRAKTGKQFLLTKGDNNNVDDRGLYNARQMWINREHVVGRVRG